jgi:hypothetical protein
MRDWLVETYPKSFGLRSSYSSFIKMSIKIAGSMKNNHINIRKVKIKVIISRNTKSKNLK